VSSTRGRVVNGKDKQSWDDDKEKYAMILLYADNIVKKRNKNRDENIFVPNAGLLDVLYQTYIC
jgi:hypothetical protein